jgi:allophanate hydrolase subunit 2
MTRAASALEVINAGWSTSVQDLGRPGHAAVGLGAAGTVDPVGMARLNQAVGNRPDAPIIETGGGLALRAHTPVMCIATGWMAPIAFGVGETISIPVSSTRRWSQVAITGGIDGPSILGSLSADTAARIVPVEMIEGSAVGLGDAVEAAPIDVTADVRATGVVRVWPGPRGDYLVEDALTSLCREPFILGEASRVGVRLTGRRLARADAQELPSEGLVPGAIQVPHDGMPIVMGPDHPVTGGYPVVGVVDPRDLWLVWCGAMGAQVRFVPRVD